MRTAQQPSASGCGPRYVIGRGQHRGVVAEGRRGAEVHVEQEAVERLGDGLDGVVVRGEPSRRLRRPDRDDVLYIEAPQGISLMWVVDGWS